jgi:hypothetical protein
MNSLFLIEAKVTIRVRGIAGPFIEPVGYLVNAENDRQARQKFEERVKHDFAHMQAETFHFEYQKMITEIK